MRNRVVAVIQARTSSERLPRKVLLPLGDRPVIDHVIAAVKSATLVDHVVLATTVNTGDDDLVAAGERMGVGVFRGSESDVLGRFVGALAGDAADVVIRHTADDPLLDPRVIDAVVGDFLRGGCDYASNILARSWPRGLDTEVFSREALVRTDREGRLPEHREHVTIYMRTHPERFRLRNVVAPADETWPELRLCVDTQEDYELLRQVFNALWKPRCIVDVKTVVAWLKAHPEVAALNAGIGQKTVFGRVF